jgi:hypothetical protein
VDGFTFLFWLILIGFAIWAVLRESQRTSGAFEEARRKAEREMAEEAKARAEAQAQAARSAHLKATRDAYRAWEYVCKAHALTCTRCGELAYPIPLTTDRYACPSCRHQFVGAPHTVPLPPPNPDAR